ncbi:MAG: hypothetical protein JOZ96_28945 [Acidobacteria bacterium]|nr:hypothetical protein [Acidobacteriota bacterium]
MNLERKLIALWLRIPERGIDVFAILFSGAGINILTGAPGSANPGAMLLSGLAIIATGVMMTLLKFQNGLIRSAVESKIKADAHAVEKYLTEGGQAPPPKAKPFSQHLDDAIADFIDGAPDAKSVGRNVGVAALLAVVGIAAAFEPALLPRHSRESEVVEKLQTIEHTTRAIADDAVRQSESFEAEGRAVQAQLKELEAKVTDLQTKLESAVRRPESSRRREARPPSP